MSWTYDVTKLADATLGPRYQVRLEVGDTNTAEQLVQDEEIDWILTQEGSTYLAAARTADVIAAKFAREVDISTQAGGTSVRASQMVAQYTKIAADLRAKANRYVAPYAGGISVADKITNEADADRVTPAFWVGMEDNPGSPSPTDQPLGDT